jgi:hypothetical protein
VAARADVLDDGAGIRVNIDLDAVDITVAQIGDREIDDPVSAEERKSPDGTEFIHPLHMMTVGCRGNDSVSII